MKDLAKDGVETDFLYEKDGVQGLWLEVKEVKSNVWWTGRFVIDKTDDIPVNFGSMGSH